MLLFTARSCRARAVALILGSILTVLAFEGGIHAAHHLGNGDGGANCPVASVTGHLVGTSVEAASDTWIALDSSRPAVIVDRWRLEDRLLAAHRGRAPPLAA